MGRPARKQHAGVLLAVLVCMAGAVHVQAAAEQNGNWNLPSLWQPLLRLAQRAAKAGEARGAAHVASVGTPQNVSAVPAVVLPEILPPQEQQAPIIEAPQGEQAPAAGAEGDSPPASRVVAVGQDTYLEPAEEEDAGIASAGPEVAKTTGNKDTQAGCSCLSSWTSNGTVQSGCANPDNDPLGAWCPVDPSECLGYYSMFRTAKGNLRYFDYCGEVRERTSSGCLCSADWSLGDDVGKQHYRDGCAQPEGPNGKRICRVDPATCPKELESEFDECSAKAQPVVLKQAATWHNCACLKGWTYKYGDGTEGTFDSCANPDGDPLGHWCEVDPAQCDNYATVVKKGQTVSIGYCASRFKQPEPTTCVAKLGLGDQCGGKSNCSSSLGCVNAPWPGACCPSGSECRHRDAVFQCMAVDTSAIVLANMPADTSSASASASAAADKAEEVAAPAAAAATDSDHRIWTQLRIAADYDALMADPVKLQAFKQDVAACLRESIGHPEFLQGAAVDAVIKGSVVALSSIDFKPDTPQAFVDVAREELAVSVPLMYEKKALDKTWGPVVTFRTAQTRAALQGSQRAGLAAAAAAPAAAGKRASPQAVGAGVAVAVCAVCVLLIVGVVIAKRRAGSVATAAPAGDVEEAGAGGVHKVTAAAKQFISSWKRGSADGSSNGAAGVWHIAAGKLFSPRADRTQHSAFMITNIASGASCSSSSALKGKLAPISPRGSGLIPAGGLQPCGDAVLSTEQLMARAEQGDYSDAGASCIMVPPPSPRTRSSVFMVAPTDTATTAAALVAATTAAAAASAAARPKSPRPAGRVSPSPARAASPSAMAAAARTQMAAAAAKAAAAWPRTAVARSRQPASPKARAAAPPVTHFSVPGVSPRAGASSSPSGVLELRPKLCVPAHPLDCVPGTASHELDELSPECASLADHASLAEPAINCLAYATQPSPAAASGKKKARGASRSPSPNPNGASSVVVGARRLLSGSSIAPFFQAVSRATRGSFGGASKGEAAAATSSSSAAPAPAAPAAPAPKTSEAAAPEHPMLSAGGATEYHSDNGSTRGSLLCEGSAYHSFIAAPQQEEEEEEAAASAPHAPARPSPKSWAAVAAQPAWKRGQQ